MKKIISIIMCICMIIPMASVCFSASAASCNCGKTPVIYIKGRTNIYKTTDDTSDGNMAETNFSGGQEAVIDTTKNILPAFIEALITDEWDDYCDVLYEEILPIYDQYALNNDGEIDNQSGIAPEWQIENLCAKAKREGSWRHKNSDAMSLQFQYDMRLDPRVNAADLKTYIDAVKAGTGHNKVSIICRCEGTVIANAYFNEYGYNDIQSVVVYNAISNGAEIADDMFSNKVVIDADAMNSFVNSFLDTSPLLDFVKASVNLATYTGLLDTGLDAFDNIYDKVSANLMPRLIRDIFGSCPGWWGMVSPEAVEECKAFVLDGNPDGIYDKLIEKIDGYNEYKKNAGGILKQMQADGVNVYLLVKYGNQMYPCIESYNILGDGVVSVYKQTFSGATTAAYRGQLSDEYIQSRIYEGYGKYISPDKMVDASTAPFADYTWYIKECEHHIYPYVLDDGLMLSLARSKTYMTVESYEEYPQFMLYKGTDPEGTVEPLTDENKDFTTDTTNTTSRFYVIINFFTTLLNWLKSLFTKNNP